MVELVLIATAFQAPEDGGTGGQRERLPQIERLLSRSRHSRLAGNWRDWLGASLAPPLLAQWSVAAMAAAAFVSPGNPPRGNTGYWLATPVHLFAGLDSLHLHPDGLLQLSAAEQQRLAADFARVFADSPWRLEPLGRRELLLCGPMIGADGADRADGADPATLPGGDPARGLPRGEGAGALRLLGSEIEMWLHGHAINREREVRGELAVTALWLWGARALQPSRALRLGRPQFFGRDIYAEALCQLLHLRVGDVSEGLSAIEAVPMRITSDTVVLMEHLSQLERPAVAAALQAVGRRQLNLHLIAGADLFSVSPWQLLLQCWRRPRPWWESTT